MSGEFDQYSATYRDEVDASLRFTGQSVDFFARRKVEVLLRSIRKLHHDPEDLKALDIGCGVGVTDRLLAPHVAQLHGVDLAADAVAVARSTNPLLHYQSYDGKTLPYDDGAFDLAFAICVLHHVDPTHRREFVAEAVRVVRPGGLLAIFEHNPFNPLTRVAVSRCEFDEGVALLRRREVCTLLEGAGLSVELVRYLLLVPLDRSWVDPAEAALGWLPLGGQHHVVARVPN